MMTNVMEQSGSPIRPKVEQPTVNGSEPAVPVPPVTGNAGQAEARTGTEEPSAVARIVQIRERIDEIDNALITLWQERAALSQEVGTTRMASGGPAWCSLGNGRSWSGSGSRSAPTAPSWPCCCSVRAAARCEPRDPR